MKAKRVVEKDAAARVEVDEKVFPRAVSVAAAYVFLDRCYLRLERGERGRLVVCLKGKARLPAAARAALAAEFENELLHQLMRHQVATATAGLREVLVGRALLSAEPQGDAGPEERPCSECEGDLDYLEDPLGIAVPWEEKYGGDAQDGEAGEGDEGRGERGEGAKGAGPEGEGEGR